MKKIIAAGTIVLGILLFGGTILIAAFSEDLNANFKTWGFMVIGYIGFALFAYGWMKISKKK